LSLVLPHRYPSTVLLRVVPDESVIGRGQVATCDVLYKQSDIAARALKYLRLSIARTISKFPLLRSLVKVTGFHVSNHDAKTIDLSAFFYAFGGVKDPFLPSLHSRTAYPVHPTIALTSVAIFSREISGSSYWNTYDVNIENLWSLFKILTLRYLIVGDLRGFDKAGEQRETISKVTSLSLHGSNLSELSLAKLLRWPKALVILRFEDIRRDSYSGLTVVEALYPQRHTLRKIYLTNQPYYDGFEEIPGGLPGFSCLKAVCVPILFLSNQPEWIGLSMADRAVLDLFEPLQSVWEALPSLLEELQLELPDVFRWLEEPANAKPWTSSDAAVEFMKCLNEIAQHRLAYYPNLRKVVVWQPNEDYFTCRARGISFDEIAEEVRTVAGFDGSGLSLSLHLCEHPLWLQNG